MRDRSKSKIVTRGEQRLNEIGRKCKRPFTIFVDKREHEIELTLGAVHLEAQPVYRTSCAAKLHLPKQVRSSEAVGGFKRNQRQRNYEPAPNRDCDL